MELGHEEEGRVNLYSVVAYIPGPLGSFLDRLREELVPSCNLKAHVTILPPRPLPLRADSAVALARERLRDFSRFEVHLENVEVFALTSVVYVGIGSGASKLLKMHDALGVDGLQFNEVYPYHPHVTLAQQMAPEQVEGIYELARCRWAQVPDKRYFPVHSLVFVQATACGAWVDLAECPIGAMSSVR